MLPRCRIVPPCHVPEENSTFLRKTLPYLSMLLYCFSTAVSASASDGSIGAGPRGVLIWCRRGSLLAQLGPHGWPEEEEEEEEEEGLLTNNE